VPRDEGGRPAPYPRYPQPGGLPVTEAAAEKGLALPETAAALYREHGVPDDRIAVSGVCTPQVARSEA